MEVCGAEVAVADGMVEGDTKEARGGSDRGCDSDPAPEVGGRLELDSGR
jgi:hypothetical protein